MMNNKLIRGLVGVSLCLFFSSCSSKHFVYKIESKLAYQPAMVLIPGGRFSMGCVSKINCKEAPQPHPMNVPSFFMASHETSVGLWEEIMEHSYGYSRHRNHNQKPIVKVSRKEVFEFINKLNKKTSMNFRLPSEAEWEYAARARTETAFYWGNFISEKEASYNQEPWKCSNCVSDSIGIVGRYPPNSFGLYDMTGHAAEMVADCLGSGFKGQPKNAKPRQLGCRRGYYLVKGGSAYDRANDLRIFKRRSNKMNDDSSYVGFRLAHDR